MFNQKTLGLESALGFSGELLGVTRGAWSVVGLGGDRRSTVVAALCHTSVDHATGVQSLICPLSQLVSRPSRSALTERENDPQTGLSSSTRWPSRSISANPTRQARS